MKDTEKESMIVLVSKEGLGGTIPLVSGKLSRTFCRLIESEQFVECYMLVSHKHLYSWVQHTQNWKFSPMIISYYMYIYSSIVSVSLLSLCSGCVLTTLLLMQAVDAHTYADQITSKFKHLCSIDPYRTGYYRDLCKEIGYP